VVRYLDPVRGNLVNGIKDRAGVRWGNNPGGHLGIINGPCAGLQFAKKELVEGFISVELRDQKLIRRNVIGLNKVGLNAVSCVSTDAGQMQGYNFSCGIGIVKVIPLFLRFFQEQFLKVPLFQGCAKSAHESEANDLRLEDVQQTTYASQFACTAPNHYPATPEQDN